MGIDAPQLANALLAGDHARAYAIVRGPNPFASSCGHGCHAPCESACRRRYFGAPVAIAALESYASAFAPPTLLSSPEPCTSAHDARSVAGLIGLSPAEAVRAPRSGKRIAVIGAGVAGLACAHDLTLLGHTCVVFDAATEPGGLLTTAIPAFRFPVASANAECVAILALGIEFQGGYRIEGASDLRALMAGEFDAIFLGLGASAPQEPMFPDQPEHADVVDAMRVLTEDVPVGLTTIVAGEGDLALDAARVALRRAARDGITGASIQLVFGQPLDQATVSPRMLGTALEEGIVIHADWTPRRYLLDEKGALSGIEIVRPDTRISKILACDRLVTAGARAPRGTSFGPDILLSASGHIVVDPDTLQTSLHGVWAGGACTSGHRSIAHAAADGKRAAWHIHGTLMQQPVRITVATAWVEVDPWDEERAKRALAAQRSEGTHPAPPPVDPFSGAALRPREELHQEATRCFDCAVLPVVDDQCTVCGKCVSACPVGAFTISAELPKQLRLDQDVCTRCGVCVTHCPEGAIAMLRAVWEERLTAEAEWPTTSHESSSTVSVASGDWPIVPAEPAED